MLSLQWGGSCSGVAYRLAATRSTTELDVLWRREMSTMAYRPVWTARAHAQGPGAGDRVQRQSRA